MTFIWLPWVPISLKKEENILQIGFKEKYCRNIQFLTSEGIMQHRPSNPSHYLERFFKFLSFSVALAKLEEPSPYSSSKWRENPFQPGQKLDVEWHNWGSLGEKKPERNKQKELNLYHTPKLQCEWNLLSGYLNIKETKTISTEDIRTVPKVQTEQNP